MVVKFRHSPLLPNNPMLMCIVGGSGSGKTHLLFNMLTTPGILDYDTLYVYTTTPNQPYYKFLKGLEELDKKSLHDLFVIYENNEDVQDIPVEQLLEELVRQQRKTETKLKVVITDNIAGLNVDNIDASKKNLVIFDDCVTQNNQQVQQDFFTKGRHQNCHCIYLSQSFYGMDSQFIRKNCNCFIFFDLSDRDLTQIMQSINHGMDPKDFRRLCRQQWDNPEDYNYVFVNTRKRSSERVKTNVFL